MPNQNREIAWQLMQRKGIIRVHSVPTLKAVVLPRELNVDGVRYDVVRDSPQNRSISIRDPAGRVVARGSYYESLTPVEAMISGFSYACTNRKLSLDELDWRVRCEWFDSEKTALGIVGVSKAYYIVHDTLVIAIKRSDSLGRALAFELLQGIVGGEIKVDSLGAGNGE